MTTAAERPEELLSVLVVTDSPEPLVAGVSWSALGLKDLAPCPVAEASSSIEAQNPDLVIVDQASKEGAMNVLETVVQSRPHLPLVLVSDAGDWGGMRAAFLRGAFDYLTKPVAAEAMVEVVHRLRVRLKNQKEGGVFSASRADSARRLLFGNAALSDPDPPFGGTPSQFWQTVFVEVVLPPLLLPRVERLIDECLSECSALGIREYGERRVLTLTILFHERWANRAERSASLHAQNLVHQLGETGVWAAVGLGTVGPAAEAAVSLQNARLAAGYSLSRGSGVYAFREEQEVAGLVCAELAPFTDEFPSRVQGGGDWRELMGRFFGVLTACASVRRLHQEVQRLFSALADLIPSSPAVERYYHIVDFVHGPDELRDELESLCARAVEAVRTRGRSLADRKLHEFQEYVGKHYGDWQLDLALVCSALQISPSYLSKIVRRELRTTFVEYVTDVRLTRSRELLSGTDLLTSQIAEQVGFVYTHYFSATFKKRYAMTPSDFRSLCRSRASSAVQVQPIDAHGVFA
jgi:AraC-like DNA-binding protein/CheY-like chemotaxis protein